MAKADDEDRTLCETPTPGKKPTTIPTWKYDAVRRAILAVVPKREPGLAFSELSDRVAAKLPAKAKAELGSIMWHVTTVKLDLEVKGEIRRVAKSSPQRLVRVTGS